jgi:hypothetical protein
MRKREVLYHITPARSVPRIIRFGFLPRTERSSYPPRIYFGRTIEDAAKVLVFKIAERNSIDHRLLVLRAQLNGLRRFTDPDPKSANSFYLEERIENARFEILHEIDVSVHTFPLGFMNMHYRDLEKYLLARLRPLLSNNA